MRIRIPPAPPESGARKGAFSDSGGAGWDPSAASIGAASRWGNRLFRLISEPMRFLPPAGIGSSPRSALIILKFSDLRVFVVLEAGSRSGRAIILQSLLFLLSKKQEESTFSWIFCIKHTARGFQESTKRNEQNNFFYYCYLFVTPSGQASTSARVYTRIGKRIPHVSLVPVD